MIVRVHYFIEHFMAFDAFFKQLVVLPSRVYLFRNLSLCSDPREPRDYPSQG